MLKFNGHWPANKYTKNNFKLKFINQIHIKSPIPFPCKRKKCALYEFDMYDSEYIIEIVL